MSFEIEKIAELVRLRLRPEEKSKLQKDLESILGYVKKLEGLDTKSVEPTSHALDMENVFRKDETKTSDVREAALKHAPVCEGKFFKVPKVVDRES